MKLPAFVKRFIQKRDPYFHLSQDLQEQRNAAQEEISLLKQKEQDLQKQLHAAQEKISLLKQKEQDLQRTISQYQTVLSEAQQESAIHLQERQEIAAEYQQLLDAAHKEIEARIQELREKDQYLREKDQEIADLKAEMENHRETYRTSLAQIIKDPSIHEDHICAICGNVMQFSFAKTIMGKYDISYFYCPHCEHLQTEKPYWLAEAYQSALSDSDTGLVQRNGHNRKLVGATLALLFPEKSNVLEYAGGYGLLTRMLRDAGAECFWYDKYATNTFARHFEDDGKRRYDLVLAFEALEHFEDPMAEFESIFSRGDSLLFSEELLPDRCPDQWWYLCTEHGQHIQFYSLKTLQYIADYFHKKLYFHNDVGLITSAEIEQEKFDQIFDHMEENFRLFCQTHTPLTVTDMNAVIKEMQHE